MEILIFVVGILAPFVILGAAFIIIFCLIKFILIGKRAVRRGAGGKLAGKGFRKLFKSDRENFIKTLKENISYYEKDREKQIDRIFEFEHIFKEEPEMIRLIENIKKTLEATEEIIKSERIILSKLEKESNRSDKGFRKIFK